MRIVSKKIREAARGQDCTLRLPGCSFDPEQTVLAHLPCGQKGVNMKSPDICGCFACYHCHALIDGPERNSYLGDMMRAWAETLLILVSIGLVKVEGMK